MSYSFILTDAILDDESPVELISGHILAKATDEQIQEIRAFLTKSHDFSNFAPPYEWLIEESNSSTHKLNVSPLGQRSWRYRVINFEGPNAHIEHLGWALQLCEHELEIGPTCCVDPGIGSAWIQQRAFISSFYNMHSPFFQRPIEIRKETLNCCKTYFDQIEAIVPTFPNVRRAIREFSYLRALPRASRFVTLGYFMVLECVLTHAPKPSDSGDSLTRQIKAKMSLLEKRFCRPLDRTGFQNGIPFDTLWGKLYGFRSRVAHGVEVDFRDSELACLTDDETVRKFMREAVKLVLIQCLSEPELMQDLQKC